MAAALLEHVAVHVAEKKPIVESLGGRPRADVTRPHGGGKLRRFFVHLGRELWNDNITDIGAMMAYYAILALFPMMVFVVTLGLLVLPQDTILQGLAMATQAMPSSNREVVTTQVSALMSAADAGFAVGGAALALWGASRGTNSLMGALNAMFNKRETRPWWRRQLIAIAVTLGVAIVVVTALALLVVGPAAGHWLADRFGLGDAFDMAWSIGRWVGAGLLVMVVWAVLYKFLPNTNAPFRIFTPGAITGVLLWLGISYGFGIYLSHFDSYAATYGALGGAIIFLTWLWLSNIALLFGAEINDVLADLRKHTSPAAAALADEHEQPHDADDAHADASRDAHADASRDVHADAPRRPHDRVS
jgi:membrane protein